MSDLMDAIGNSEVISKQLEFIEIQKEKMERLKKLVVSAYEEGWLDGNDEDCDGELGHTWINSKSFKALKEGE